MKSNNYINWNDYFMGIAILSAQRSKDPSTKVGACIVDNRKHIIGIGYNGFPNGCSDDEFPWAREGGFLDTKYAYVVHAEPNAILNSNASLVDTSLYVTLFPCNECAKLIIQSGIRKVYYCCDKYDGTESNIASKKMFKAAGVECIQIDKPKIKGFFED